MILKLYEKGVIILCLLFVAPKVGFGQQLIVNGSFDQDTLGWYAPCPEPVCTVEATYYETTYGGTNANNHVAEIDDQSNFYQEVCVLPGASYILSMDASRRSGSDPAPNPEVSHIQVDGLDANGNVVTNYVSMNYTRTNTVFSLTPVANIPVITVPLNSGVVKLKIYFCDSTPGPYMEVGMIIDNVSLVFQTQPAITLSGIAGSDTICTTTTQAFDVSNLSDTSAAIHYAWNFGTAATPETATSATGNVSWSAPALNVISCAVGNGTCNVLNLDDTAVVLPLPDNIRIDTNICFGTAVQLNIPVAGAALPYNIVWAPALYLNNGSIADPICMPTADTDISYTVSIAYESSTHCVNVDTVRVMHLTKISLPGTDTTVCAGTALQIPLSGSQSYSYYWTPAAGLNSNTVATPLVTPDSTVTYKITASYWGCKDSLYYTINTIAPPVISGFSSINATACGFCDGSMTVEGLMPDHAYTLSYLVGGASQLAAITSDSAGSATVANLCQGAYDNIIIHSGICASSVPGSVIISAPPQVPSFTYKIHKGCVADTVIFTNTSQYTGAVSYRWDFGDNTFDTATSPIHIYTQQGTFYVTLFIRNTFCIDSVTDTIPSFHHIKAAFTTDSSLFCQGQQVVCTNNSMGAGLTYTWSFDDGTTDTSANPTHIYQNAGAYHILLTIRDTMACFDTVSHPIQVDSISSISLSLSDTSLCEGKGVTLTGIYASTGNTGVIWSFGDGATVSGVNPVFHAYDTTGNFTITLRAGYRVCPDMQVSKKLDVYPYPIVDIGPDTTICPGQPFSLILINLSAQSQNLMYKNIWSTGDTTATTTAQAAGSYWLSVISDKGCSASDSMQVFPGCYLGIPNAFTPNGDGINDYFFPRQLLSNSIASFTMAIYNRWGEKVFETNSIDGRGWDGRFNNILQSEGVYIYLIDATFSDGKAGHWQGNITLLR